jgi:UDP-N-acetyl-D-glucosamine/UDP-N-acetyl-D-galactosamine dehydrogenase
MGLAFKENCPDLRNTKVVDIVRELAEYNIQVDVYDPWVSVEEAQHEYGITPIAEPALNIYDGIILAVAHNEFRALGAECIRKYGKAEHVLFDLKYLLSATESDLRL